MATPQARQWGKTPPFSVSRPTDRELAVNDAMLAELRAQNSWEPIERTRLRQHVLKSLQSIAVNFIAHIGHRKKIPQNIIDGAGGLIFPFGSYRLGVHGPGSDIDTLILGPRHVTRNDYFEHFPEFLMANAPKGSIEELVPVRETSAPIIKLKYSDIDLDLAYVPLERSSVPPDLDIKDDSLIRNLDDAAVRNFNGVRVAAEIIGLIPQQKSFGHALRTIKLWAKRRGIDAAIVGYPGGIAWAIMVARICQLYPNACGSVIVSKVFHLMRIWTWSYKNPVELKERRYVGVGSHRQWNPVQEKGDAAHLMPVITPSYPCMCTTHTVSRSTLRIIMHELERAEKIVSDIVTGQKEWSALFQHNTFFVSDYKYYLAVISSSNTKDGLKKWSSFVNSRVRHLATHIVTADNDVVLAVPYVEGFTRVHQCRTREEKEKILGGNLDYQIKETTAVSAEDISKPEEKSELMTAEAKTQEAAADTASVKGAETSGANGETKQQATEDGTPVDRNAEGDARDEEPLTIFTTTFYIGLEIQKGTKQLNLQNITEDFKWSCMTNPQFDKELMMLRVTLVKSANLPDDVFKDGMKRPQKVVKSKKRTVNDANLDDRAADAARRKVSDVTSASGHATAARAVN